jgi:glucose-6-phosphate isomerase
MPTHVSYDFSATQCTDQQLHLSLNNCIPLTDFYKKVLQEKVYDTPESFLYAPFDTGVVEGVERIAQRCASMQPRYCVVIGIGGSSLGAQAVYEALPQSTGIPLLFADTIDTAYVRMLYELVDAALKKGENVILAVVSKSGTTLETLVNFQIFLALLKKYKQGAYHQYCVIITDENSWLYQLGMAEKMPIVPIAKQIGGRFSVLTAAGLFPLLLSGIDTQSFLKGAQDATKQDLQKKTPLAALAASTIWYHYQQGIRINDLFIFCVSLESMGKWCRQLMGESIGKSYTTDNVYLPQGITSTVSIGTVDLHAVAQLYLAGPKDRLTTFITVQQQPGQHLVLSDDALFKDSLAYAPGRSLADFMHAIEKGVERAYAKYRLPFYTICIPELTTYTLGYFMQMQMMMTVYLGRLMRLNPFDQPAVEAYKEEARRLLKEMH